VVHPQRERFAAVFYPFGHPTPYVYDHLHALEILVRFARVVVVIIVVTILVTIVVIVVVIFFVVIIFLVVIFLVVIFVVVIVIQLVVLMNMVLMVVMVIVVDVRLRQHVGFQLRHDGRQLGLGESPFFLCGWMPCLGRPC
jgi:hypothetical protein